jgi:hypothetical protein
MGLDLGQKKDFTALVVMEQTRVVYDARDPVTYSFLEERRCVVRHAERMPLGTTYPEVADRVEELIQKAMTHVERPALVVDATGVGAPVVDLLKSRRMPCTMIPVTITGGDRASTDGVAHWVPKRDLIAGLQVAFENEELEIAAGMTEMDALVEELMGMRVEVRAGGERYGAWRTGAHDDLVLAMALAWWQVARRTRGVHDRRR